MRIAFGDNLVYRRIQIFVQSSIKLTLPRIRKIFNFNFFGEVFCLCCLYFSFDLEMKNEKHFHKRKMVAKVNYYSWASVLNNSTDINSVTD